MQTKNNWGTFSNPGDFIFPPNLVAWINIDFIWRILYLSNSALHYPDSDSDEALTNVSADEVFIIPKWNQSSNTLMEPLWRKSMPNWCRSVRQELIFSRNCWNSEQRQRGCMPLLKTKRNRRLQRHLVLLNAPWRSFFIGITKQNLIDPR